MALREPIDTINPLSASEELRKVTRLLFSGLVRMDAQLRPVPDLAESWTASSDERVWTFKLRTNVRWHDGTTLTSEDVRFTYRALMDGPAGAGQAWATGSVAVAQADMREMVEQVEAVDPYTVRLTLRRRFAPLLADLSVPILPRHLLAEATPADLWRESITVGSGPFQVSERRGGDALILSAFARYYLGRPYIDEVAFLKAADEGAIANALSSGQVLLAEIGAKSASLLSQSQTVQVVPYPDLGFYYVGFNLRQGHLFADKRLRQALAYAVDKVKLVADTQGNSAEPAWSSLPAFSWAYAGDSAIHGRDLVKARAVLDAAGWQQLGRDGIRLKDGQRLSAELMVRQDAPERIAAARALAGQLRDVGLDLDVAPSDFASTMAAARQPPFEFTAMLMGWVMGEDPDDYYLFHSSQVPSADRPSGYNYVGFRNADFDRLSSEARSTTDWQRRTELYRQTQSLLADELPYYFLWADRRWLAVNRRVLGFPATPSPSLWWSIPQWRLPRG